MFTTKLTFSNFNLETFILVIIRGRIYVLLKSSLYDVFNVKNRQNICLKLQIYEYDVLKNAKYSSCSVKKKKKYLVQIYLVNLVYNNYS